MANGSVLEAILFYLYILAALSCTSLICYDLFQLYARTPVGKERRPNAVWRRFGDALIFGGLFVISFSTLSFHMLKFLGDSYSGWVHTGNVTVAEPLREMATNPGRLTLHIWTWSTSTPLFQDFATVICDDPVRFWWTQQALILSLAWNVYMAIEGTRRRIPRLWAYFVLDQILPVSLTVNLFCVAVAIGERPDPSKKWYVPDAFLQILPVVGYYATLSMAPTAVNSAYLILVILLTRLLLFMPYILLAPKRQIDWIKPEVTFFEKGIVEPYKPALTTLILGALVLYTRQTIAMGQITLPQLTQALQSSPAVSALGYDYLLAVGNVVAFWRSGVGKN